MLIRYLQATIECTPPPLLPGEVHIWNTCVNGDSAHIPPGCLNQTELERAARFRAVPAKVQYSTNRSWLRYLLGRYLGIAPLEVPIIYEEAGKPILQQREESPCVHFNVSHSGQLGVIAITHQGRIGIDIELRREIPHVDQLVERFFTEREREIFRALASESWQTAFFNAWTRKEAALKAIGRGIQSLDCCDVTFREDEPPALLRLENDYSPNERWELTAWAPEAGYQAALVVEKSA